MKLGIIVGHTHAGKGAHSPFLNAHEYDWNGVLASRILELGSILERKIFLRDHGGIEAAYTASDEWGSEVTVELHFNSAHTESATGTGVLYYPGSTRGKKLASLIRQHLGEALDLPDWPKDSGGVVTPFQASGLQRRGERSLKAGRAPATLIEPFFGSNATDSGKAAARRDDLARAVLRAAESYFH